MQRLVLVVLILVGSGVPTFSQPRPLYPILHDYAKGLYKEYKTIPEERRFRLEAIADFILQNKSYNRLSEVLFIGTNQSTRSQLAQVWAYAAAHYYGLEGAKFYSGGIQQDPISENTIEVLERAGFIVYRMKEGNRRYYQVKFSYKIDPVILYSKEIEDRNNPPTQFMAVIVCQNAAQNLPVIKGTFNRLELTYYDPSGYDGLEEEKEEYDKVCHQIALEMFYLFSKLKNV